MGNVELKLNKGALRSIMADSRGIIEQATSQMGSAAESMGKGLYTYDVIQGKVSPHGMVKTDDFRAMLDNAYHNTLLKSMDAGRV